MIKKTLLSLAAILAVLLPAVHLEQSVAELRHAASVRTATSLHIAPAKTVKKAPVVMHQTAEKSRLEKILDESGVRSDKRPLAAAVLGLMDDACLEKLETFTVLYGKPQHRGLAGRGVIIVSGIVPDQEFVGLLLHEGLGHFREITCLAGTPQSGASAFRDGTEIIWNDDPSVAFYSLSWKNEKTRRADAKRDDFVTGYAYEADNFEDLAESVTYYITQEKKFRARAAENSVLAQKLTWLETHMPKTKQIAESTVKDDGKIAWDATKLAFTWMGN